MEAGPKRLIVAEYVLTIALAAQREFTQAFGNRFHIARLDRRSDVKIVQIPVDTRTGRVENGNPG